MEREGTAGRQPSKKNMAALPSPGAVTVRQQPRAPKPYYTLRAAYILSSSQRPLPTMAQASYSFNPSSYSSPKPSCS